VRVFENSVLRRIFGRKRDEVKGEWRKLHNDKLYNLYSSPGIIRQIKLRRMRWARHVERMGEERKVYKVLVGKAEGKRLVASCCESGDEPSGSCSTKLVLHSKILF
jgi:hypothetical protein